MNSKMSIGIFTSALFFLCIIYFPTQSGASILRGNQVSQDIAQRNDKSPLYDVLDDEKSRLDYENQIQQVIGNHRVKRTMKEDIESGFKEFADKVAKLPDQLSGSLKKYFEEKGVSLESVQKILNDIWSGVEKLIEEIKKAL